jgi:hypothetical protein
MIIPRRNIPQLRKASGFFNAFIDRNFSNSNDFFDNNGNYILKKDLLPEDFYYYDKNTNSEYTIKREEVWKALPDILLEGHISEPILGKLIANWFMFNTDTFFQPTLPESEKINGPNGYYVAEPSRAQRKKQRSKKREIQTLKNELYEGLNNNNNYLYRVYTPFTQKELLEFIEIEKRKDKIAEIKEELKKHKNANVEDLVEALEDIYTKSQLAHAISETEKATANRTKYGKEKTLRRKPLKEMFKEKRRTQKRERARKRKTMKHSRLNNNNNNGNSNNNNEGQY